MEDKVIEKIDEYYYEINTAGLGGKMFFCGGVSCGKITDGIELRIDLLEGGWVISLSEAWQMVFVSTFESMQQKIRKIRMKFRR